MNSFTTLLLNREKVSAIIMAALISCIALLTFRMKYTNSPYYLFLVWNLILAGIPFLLSTYLISTATHSKFKVGFTFIIWLLFLPNAPYIVTDLYHLRLSGSHLIWLDALVLFSFALAGLVLFYFSLCDMNTVLNRIMNKKYAKFIMYLSCFLSAFGIYLGRFLRYNSWELLSNPSPLLEDCILILLFPRDNSKAWLFVLCTGFLLSIGFFTFKLLTEKK